MLGRIDQLDPLDFFQNLKDFDKKSDITNAISSGEVILPPGSNQAKVEAFWKTEIQPKLKLLSSAIAKGDVAQTRQLLGELEDIFANNGGRLSVAEATVLLDYVHKLYRDVLNARSKTSTTSSSSTAPGPTSPSTPPGPPTSSSPPPSPRPPLVRNPLEIKEAWPELNENIWHFLFKGTEVVGPEFLRIKNSAGNYEWIDILKTDFTDAEKRKILQDFHLFILIQADIMMDDVASKSKGGGFATTLQRLRVRGEWKIDSGFFLQNPHRTSPSDPTTLEGWAEALPSGLRALLYNAESLMMAYVGASNSAKEIIALFPESAGKKGGDKDIIESLKSHAPPNSFDIEQVMKIVSGTQFDTGVTPEAGYPKSVEKGETLRDSVLGDLVREAVFAFDRMFRDIAITDGPKPKKWGELFPHGAADSMNSAYTEVLKHLEVVLDQIINLPQNAEWKDIINHPDAKTREDRRKLYLKWAVQSGFDVAWTYFQALGYDKKSMQSTLAEGMNAEVYHFRDKYGIPAKTAYNTEVTATTSKAKTPRVTDRAKYYYSTLEFMHVPTLLHINDIEILHTAADFEDFFRDELVKKYGDNPTKDRFPNRNKSAEYLQLLGQMPEDLVFDSNGDFNYAEIARHFVLIRVKPQRTAYDPASKTDEEQRIRWSPDAMMVRRTAIESDVQEIRAGRARHIQVWASAYDTLFRYKFPLFDDEAKRPLVQWRTLDVPPSTISKNWGDAMSHENTFFMEPAMTDKVSLLSSDARDRIEWSVDATQVGGLTADLQGVSNRALSILPRPFAKIVLQRFRKNPQKEIGAQMFSRAVQMVNVAPYSIKGDAFSRMGLDALNDKYDTYYFKALLMGEGSYAVKPEYHPTGKLKDVHYTKRPETRVPLIWDTLYRNVFIPWSEHPLFKSRRTFEIQRELDNELLPKEQREIDNTWLQVEGALTIFSIYISQYMPHPNKSWIKAQENGDYDEEEEIINQYHIETGVARTIIDKEEIYLRMPEDVQCEAKILTEFLMRKFSTLFRSVNGRDAKNDEELQQFIKRTKPRGLVKNEDQLDTWGFTKDEIYRSLLAMYSFNNISSGPSAAGASFDWLALAMRGKVARFARTKDIIDHLRETRHDGGLFGFGKGFAPPASGKK